MLSSSLLLLLLTTTSYFVIIETYDLTLNSDSSKCFEQFLQHHDTLELTFEVIGSEPTGFSDIKVTIRAPNDELIQEGEHKTRIISSITAKQSGVYMNCFDNQSGSKVLKRIRFEMQVNGEPIRIEKTDQVMP